MPVTSARTAVPSSSETNPAKTSRWSRRGDLMAFSPQARGARFDAGSPGQRLERVDGGDRSQDASRRGPPLPSPRSATMVHGPERALPRSMLAPFHLHGGVNHEGIVARG